MYSVLIWISCKKTEKSGLTSLPSHNELFSLLSSVQTHIDFQNKLEEGPNTNILLYEYFYNGGGVAAADFNNDGLIDLYFTSNMGDNKLYLNKGSLQFEDITDISGAAGRPGPWKTGVTAVDINGDHLMDIYICYSGALPEEKRTNQLFINKGINSRGTPLFEDQAVQYGLDNKGYSTQSYFFDYDRDGDLDMILLNHNPKNLPILNEESTAQMFLKDDPLRGTRLYRNENGHFTDITQQAGLNGSALSYGLGIAISDYNEDGWPDFYVSNDYMVPDFLYINDQHGKFKNELAEQIGHTSQFSMGNDAADINNDGHMDIYTLDMLPEDNHRQKLLLAPDNYSKFDFYLRSGFYYQYMRNMLQLNNGDGTFSEIGQLAGISNTDWSWSALIADFDDDGWRDIHVTNGYKRDYTNLDFINYMDDYTKSKGRLLREDVMEIISHMPASNVSNYFFTNNHDLTFKNNTKPAGLDRPSNSNGAAYADLDNDGDLDLIVNNIDSPAFIYQNNTKENHSINIELNGEKQNSHGIGAKIKIKTNNQWITGEQYPSRGYQSSVSPVLHFGVGNSTQVDSIKINWPSGKSQILTNVQTGHRLILKESDAKANIEKGIKIIPVFTKTTDLIKLKHEQTEINDFDRQILLPYKLTYTGPILKSSDVNGDGLEDILLIDSIYLTKVYLQQKNGSFTMHEHTDPIQLKSYRVLDGDCSVSIDANHDGALDVFVGKRYIPGSYPLSPPSYILLNDGKGNYSKKHQSFDSLGMVTDAISIDLNGDSWQDLMVVGDCHPITLLINHQGTFKNETSNYLDKDLSGFWNTIASAEFNHDQKPDFIIGNIGLNTQLKANDPEPLSIYYKDFDKNGSIDPIMSFYIQGKNYPYVTRDEMTKQLTYLKPRFTSFESYADITMDNLFQKSELKDASNYRVNELETIVLLSEPSGKYKIKRLPIQAQYSPVKSIVTADFNHDQQMDLLLAGNESQFKIKLGKADANHGILLSGDGSGNFSYVDQVHSGLNIQGDVKSMIHISKLKSVVFGINGKQSVTYKYR